MYTRKILALILSAALFFGLFAGAVTVSPQTSANGNFLSLQLLSYNGGIAVAVIAQCDDISFYAVSSNFADWEITNLAADYHDFLPLSDAGILHVERLPFRIDDDIIWVGFIVREGQERRQIRLFSYGELLNPLPENAQPFLPGLERVSWGHEAVEFVVARGLMDMFVCPEVNEPILFNPSARTTRGEVLAAAVKALSLTAQECLVSRPFDDVPLIGQGVYIDIARRLGLVSGVGDNRFAPDSPISRQDMMTMLYNILLSQGLVQPDTNLTTLGHFSDLHEIADYARLPIASLARAGIIAGNGVNINPRAYMTRVEAAMFVRNLYRVSME